MARLEIKNHLAIVLDRKKTPPPNEAYDEPRHLHEISWLLMRWALAREHAQPSGDISAAIGRAIETTVFGFDFAALRAGDAVTVSITGRSPLAGRVSYLSPKPEFTPPVLYNRENRAKLVFLVEATFADPTAARDLHPGQPADVAPAK